MHQGGLHPHISIEDRVFVETVGGDLTIKIENNTASGEGIYSEPVDNPDQTLDDAEIYYAIVGNLILLKIRPYQEERVPLHRLQRKGRRTPSGSTPSPTPACCCPDGHGLIFPQGYYLQTGEYKTFDTSVTDMVFETASRVAERRGLSVRLLQSPGRRLCAAVVQRHRARGRTPDDLQRLRGLRQRRSCSRSAIMHDAAKTPCRPDLADTLHEPGIRHLDVERTRCCSRSATRISSAAWPNAMKS